MIHPITQAVALIVLGRQETLFAQYLDSPVAVQGASADAEPLALRECIRLAFQEAGVEVEFSGKGPHERGVVIDLDTDRMHELHLDPDTLRFGQTVVKINNQPNAAPGNAEAQSENSPLQADITTALLADLRQLQLTS